MKVLEQGYEVIYTIANMRSIKVTPSGDYQGNKYGASVKIKSVNLIQEEDEKYGLVEKEQILEFKVSCPDSKLRQFNEFLRDLQKANKPLTLSCGLPMQAGKDTYTVTSVESADVVMDRVLKAK